MVAPARFVWTDLSTFDVGEARRFYSSVFGWKFYDEDGYQFAYRRRRPIAGIYEMPAFFQEINMPSFWMSYVAVEGIDGVVERARRQEGAIVEVEPEDFGEGKVALIRDPAGAGFTVYEGSSIDARGTRPGDFVWNDLITSDIESIEGFYVDVLGWSLSEDGDGRYRVVNGAGEHQADLVVVDAPDRGDKVFWVPYFLVKNLEKFTRTVEREGGSAWSVSVSDRGSAGFFSDTQGATFAVVER